MLIKNREPLGDNLKTVRQILNHQRQDNLRGNIVVGWIEYLSEGVVLVVSNKLYYRVEGLGGSQTKRLVLFAVHNLR